MKKFLIAIAAASFLLLGGQTEAATVDNLDEQTLESQDVSHWTHFRDKHILHRETENERRDRKDWERRHNFNDRHNPQPPHHGHGFPPPPRR